MDPLRHPDLIELSHLLRDQLDAVLNAEQEAAAAARRRRRTLRDRLLEAEDRGETITVGDVAGRQTTGRVTGVGADHVTLDDRFFVRLDHCVQLIFP